MVSVSGHDSTFWVIKLSPLNTVALSLVLFFRALLALVRTILFGHTKDYAGARTRFSDMIHVKWNKDVLHFPLPLDTTLGQLRTELAAYTQLKTGSFKLVFKGAVMKDDNTPLRSYGVKEGGTVWLIGGNDGVTDTPAPKLATPKSAPQTEEATIEAIRAELAHVREGVVPDVEAFVGALRVVPADPPSTPPPPTQMDHTRLSELLLQSLLRLDAMFVPGVDWPEARVERKAAVKEVQGVLDRLDGAWAAR